MRDVTNKFIATPDEAEERLRHDAERLMLGQNLWDVARETTPWRYYTLDNIHDLEENHYLLAQLTAVPWSSRWKHAWDYVRDQIQFGRGTGGPLLSQRTLIADNHTIATLDNITIESIKHIENKASRTAAYSCIIRDATQRTYQALFFEGVEEELPGIPSADIEQLLREAAREDEGTKSLYVTTCNIDFHVLSKKSWGTLLPLYQVRSHIFITSLEINRRFRGDDDNNDDSDVTLPTPAPPNQLVAV